MAFNIRLLDKLSYDEVEPLLGDYIDDAIDAFVNSEWGQAQIKVNPEGGQWIGTFIEIAYQYGEMTLPKMTKADAQGVMEQIMPAKITLADRSDCDGAIEELVAFWTFLKQEYKLRSAGAIAKYLNSIEGQFTDWMFDPNRGGIAKRFMMEGLQAGFEMETQAGIEAFQKVYNDRLAADPDARLELPSSAIPSGAIPSGAIPSNVVNLTSGAGETLVPMEAPPADVKQMLDVLGIDFPPEGELIDPEALMAQMMIALEQIDEAGMERLVEIELDENGDRTEVNPSAVPISPITAEARQGGRAVQAAPDLSDEQEALLRAQQITTDGPGTILQNFQMLLDTIGNQGIPVSAARHQFALKRLEELNQKLVNPIDIDLKRPAQKSFPPLNGLYLLLRATGMVRIEARGKKVFMVLNPEIYESWQQLNPTERYCTLLEAWLVRAHPEMLGEDRSPINEGIRSLRNWPDLSAKPKLTYASYRDQDVMSYWPGFHNLALMEMFGFLKITSGKPETGKGWRMKRLEALPLGNAVMPLLFQAVLAADLRFEAETDPTLPFNDFQPALQPYFPEWQKTLATPTNELRKGRHIFKVSLVQHKVWRRVAISGEVPLVVLSGLILDAFEFADYEHLDAYTYTNQVGRKIQVMHPMGMDGDRFTDEVQVGSLPLSEGSILEYVFDFGNWWEFKIQLEAVEPEAAPQPSAARVSGSRKPQAQPVEAHPTGEILGGEGEAPPQYGGAGHW